MSITQASSKSSEIALISEEERAALDKVRLDDDVSESTIRTETKSAIVLVDKQEAKFIGPPIPAHRDAMGKYIPPKHGQPLTFCDVPTPGPADYAFDFNIVSHRYPVLSLGERPPEPKRTKQKRTPAPNKYNLHSDPVWGKCKRCPIGIKLPNPEFHKVRKSPGPGAYCPNRNICNGPKFSMGTKDERVIGGLVSKLVTIPDPRNPGPSFCPVMEEWLQKPKSFGLTFHKDDPQPGPGPGKYLVSGSAKGPKWKIGSRPDKEKTVEMPGPANYGFKSTIGSGPRFHIGKVAPDIHSRFVTPGPNLYNREGFHLDEPGFTMKYRWFDTKPKRVPGPNKYTVQEEVVKKRCPAYTMSKKTKPTYPASVYSAARPEGPGPGEYDLPEVMQDTGKTFGERHLEFPAEGPAPADCQDLDLINVSLPNAPSYSFGGKHAQYVDYDIPGPHRYDVKFSHLVQPAGKSMGLKRSGRTAHTAGPGPAGYNVDLSKMDCPCSLGTSVSSRHTPFKFNGVGHKVILRDPPRDIPKVPLLG